MHYVNAHATGTVIGDTAESHATASVFGDHVPVSSPRRTSVTPSARVAPSKLRLAIGMMREGFIAPTRNLEEVDPKCAPLDYVRELRERSRCRSS